MGEETFGGVISTGSFKLIDGTRVRQPFRGWYLPDGTDMESRGAIPEVRVERTPTDEAADRDMQLEVAVQTLLGSARLARELEKHPAELRNMVTSPGGTTAAGLQVLEDAGLRGAIIDAVEAAYERAKELQA